MSVSNMASLNKTLTTMTKPSSEYKQIDLYHNPDDRTYQDDAILIDNMFIFQLVSLIVCFITSNFGCFKKWNDVEYKDIVDLN